MGPGPRAAADARDPRAPHDDPVLAAEWSADGAWLSCEVATDGGVRTQVWVVRPDRTDARRIAGSRRVHAELGPWTRSGHRGVVTIPSPEPGHPTHSHLADPATGELTPLATGDLIHVLDISIEERPAVLRDGRRGHRFCVAAPPAPGGLHEGGSATSPRCRRRLTALPSVRWAVAG